jgi:hypothetical protein
LQSLPRVSQVLQWCLPNERVGVFQFQYRLHPLSLCDATNTKSGRVARRQVVAAHPASKLSALVKSNPLSLPIPYSVWKVEFRTDPTAATEVDFFRRLLLAMRSAICCKGCTTFPSAAVYLFPPLKSPPCPIGHFN